MRQSLRILELPLLELREYLEIQIEENPALKREDTPDGDSLLGEKIEQILEKERGPLDLRLSQTQDDIQKKRDYKNSLISKAPTLEEHLLKQLRVSALDKENYKIGEYILANLDENGYLNLSIEEIMVKFNQSLSLDKKIARKTVESILSLIYCFDPPGIGAKNLKECLLIQLRLQNNESSLAYKIVNLYLSELIKNKRPTAVFCLGDEMAIGAIRSMKENNVKCPEDISILGYDDMEVASLFVPRLTTMARPVREMGKIAVDIIIDKKEVSSKIAIIIKGPDSLIADLDPILKKGKKVVLNYYGGFFAFLLENDIDRDHIFSGKISKTNHHSENNKIKVVLFE